MNRRLPYLRPELVFYSLSGASALLNATMFTTYVVYFVNSVGLNPLQLVLVGTALETTYFLFEIPTGVVADAYSRRLSVILGMFFLGAAFLLVGAVPLFAAVLAGQAVSAIGYTFLSGATDAWLAGEAGEDSLGHLYLRAGQIGRLAGMAGIGLSVVLASVSPQLPFLAGGLGYLVLGLFLILFMPERSFARPEKSEHMQTTWSTMQHTLREGVRVLRFSPVLILLLGVEFFTGAASEGFDRLGDAHLLANFSFPALNGLQPVVWFGILSLSADLASLVITELVRRRWAAIGRSPAATARTLLVLNGLSLASHLVFALTGRFALAAGALITTSVLRALAGPLYTPWLVQNINPSVRATVLSMNGQANAIGQILGGPGVGALGSFVSLRAALAAAGLLLSPISLLYARALRGGPALASSAEPQAPLPEASL